MPSVNPLENTGMSLLPMNLRITPKCENVSFLMNFVHYLFQTNLPFYIEQIGKKKLLTITTI